MRQAKLITIRIDTSNAAFDDCERGEISRILRTLCRDILSDAVIMGENGLYDINGNTTGRINVEPSQ